MGDIVRIKSISEVHDFLGIQKPKHPLVSVLPIDEKISNAYYGDVKYVCDFYQISLKKGIKGNITYGRNSYDFDEGSLIFMKPGQTFKVEIQKK